MKVRVYRTDEGWQWEVVARNGAPLARSLNPVRRDRAVDQAERLAVGIWPVDVED